LDFLQAQHMITIGIGNESATFLIVVPVFFYNFMIYKITDFVENLGDKNFIDKTDFKNQIKFDSMILLEDTKRVKLYTDGFTSTHSDYYNKQSKQSNNL